MYNAEQRACLKRQTSEFLAAATAAKRDAEVRIAWLEAIAAEEKAQGEPVNTALRPIPKIEDDCYDWYVRHEEKRAAVAQKSHDLVFIGDSITHFWEDRNGPEVWRDYYGRREVLNLGFGWDRTQNAFWRLLNGEFAKQRPKLLVLNIGTNNLTAGRVRANTPEEVAAGVAGVCRLVHELSPETKILDMHIFPRGAKDTELFQSVMRTNALLDQELKSLPYVSIMDITAQMVDGDGDAHPELFMPDLTHPGPKGYAVWAAAIEPVVKAALGD